MEIIAVENLTFRYNGAARPALNGVDLSVKSGEFLLLCGESGCGKSTLLRLMKRELAPAGERGGRLRYMGTDLAGLSARAAAGEIGFVMQNPDDQIVTDKVWHELAFGLESLGTEPDAIRRRVAEVCGFFGISDWFHRATGELSGGQKQLLNLASVVAMRPRLLILDEPTSQLDPIAASEFLSALCKLNRETGMSVLLAEHRLEEVFPAADRVAVMEEGRVTVLDAPRRIGERLEGSGHRMRLALPAAVRIHRALGAPPPCPLTVREGRDFLQALFPAPREEQAAQAPAREKPAALEISGGYFRYERDTPDVLRGLSLKAYGGEILCVLGGNGAGKTTLLKVLGGVKRVYRGRVRVRGKKLREYPGASLYRRNISILPQDPQTLFVKRTVRQDLLEAAVLLESERQEAARRVDAMLCGLGISHLSERHPMDLSGGERQKAALAKVLLLQPEILLLDEPTKGLDACSKAVLSGILRRFKAEGKAVVMVTHDVEFAAENADRCAMFFDGQIVSDAPPEAFFSENTFYTTAASRIAREVFPNAVTVEQVVKRAMEGRNLEGEASPAKEEEKQV